MKSAFPILMMLAVLAGLSGCNGLKGFLSPHGRCLIDGSCGHCSDCPATCQSCDCDTCGSAGQGGGEVVYEDGCRDGCCGDGCGLFGRSRAREAFNPGPATGAVTYPYYTTRGPRDFFTNGPSSIGP